MLKQHIEKTIGLFVSQLVLLPEIMAMNGTIDLTQLHGTELYVVIGFYVFQTIIGIYFGNRYDRKNSLSISTNYDKMTAKAFHQTPLHISH